MRLVPTLLAVLAVALATGCGDDDGEAPETVTVTETVTTPAEPDVTLPVEPPQAEPPGPPEDEPEEDSTQRSCGQVGFEPNTDAGAFQIRSQGVPCETARAVARAAEGQGGLTYSARGFECQGERQDTELPSVRWVCLADAQQQVTFQTS